MKIHVKSTHLDQDVILKFGHYGNKTTAINGVSVDGEPLFTATVALDEIPAEGCVYLKGWGENEGIPEALVKAGVLEFTGKEVPIGYAVAIEAKLICVDRK